MKKALNLLLIALCLIILAGCEKKAKELPDTNDVNNMTTQTR